jgi:hypothetical protein
MKFRVQDVYEPPDLDETHLRGQASFILGSSRPNRKVHDEKAMVLSLAGSAPEIRLADIRLFRMQVKPPAS